MLGLRSAVWQAQKLYHVAVEGKASETQQLLAEGVPPDAHLHPKVSRVSSSLLRPLGWVGMGVDGSDCCLLCVWYCCGAVPATAAAAPHVVCTSRAVHRRIMPQH